MDRIATENAPAAIGPYSQAIVCDGWLFSSGQIGLDPSTMQIVDGGFEAQAHQVMKNLSEVLSSAGCSFENVVKSTIYLADMADFPIINEIYGNAMGSHRPARSTVQAGGLPMGALVEIDVVARVGQ